MKALSTKIPDEELELLKAQAGAAGFTLSQYVRQILSAAARAGARVVPPQEEPRPSNEILSEVRRTIRQSVWAVIVALSQDLDEEAAMEYVRKYMGRANDLGFVSDEGE